VAASLVESVGAAADDATLEVAVTLVQTSEVAVKIDDGDKVEEVRAAFEAEVCAGDDSCSVEVVYRRLRARALDFSTAALTGAEDDATAFTLRIVRELSGADSLAAPQLDKRAVEETIEAAAGTGVEIVAPPAVTKLEAAVATTVEGAGGADRARALQAGLGDQLAAAAAEATGVGSAAAFDVEVRAEMPPSTPPAPPPSPNPPPPSYAPLPPLPSPPPAPASSSSPPPPAVASPSPSSSPSPSPSGATVGGAEGLVEAEGPSVGAIAGLAVGLPALLACAAAVAWLAIAARRKRQAASRKFTKVDVSVLLHMHSFGGGDAASGRGPSSPPPPAAVPPREWEEKYV